MNRSARTKTSKRNLGFAPWSYKLASERVWQEGWERWSLDWCLKVLYLPLAQDYAVFSLVFCLGKFGYETEYLRSTSEAACLGTRQRNVSSIRTILDPLPREVYVRYRPMCNTTLNEYHDQGNTQSRTRPDDSSKPFQSFEYTDSV